MNRQWAALSLRRGFSAPRPASFLTYLVHTLAGHPARLLILSWAAFFAAYFCGPVVYEHEVAAGTWVFVWASVVLFAMGAVMTTRARSLQSFTEWQSLANSLQVDAIVQRASLLALAGGLATTIDKLVLAGLDYSHGITALRFEQHEQVIIEGLSGHERSMLLYVGYATMGFSAVSYALYILRGDTLSRRSVWLAHAALLAPAAYSVLYGGRSPFALVLGLAGGASIVRAMRNQSWLPREPLCRPALVTVLLVYVAYSNFIFVERRAYQRLATFESQAARYEDQLDARVRPGVLSLVERGWLDEDVLTSLMSLHVYFTHELTILDRTLRYEGGLGPYYGQYEMYLAAVALRQVIPVLSYADDIRTEAQAADLYGWFQTAWGQMFLDFGLVGAYIAAFVYGCACGFAYSRGVRPHYDVRMQLLLAYTVNGIALTPIQSVFSISISPQILFAILICPFLGKARMPVRRQAPRPLPSAS